VPAPAALTSTRSSPATLTNTGLTAALAAALRRPLAASRSRPGALTALRGLALSPALFQKFTHLGPFVVVELAVMI
jgi:hypothetical protein